jgi:hypothetical protein
VGWDTVIDLLVVVLFLIAIVCTYVHLGGVEVVLIVDERNLTAAAVARWSRTVRPTPPTHLTRSHWMRRAFGHLP